MDNESFVLIFFYAVRALDMIAKKYIYRILAHRGEPTRPPQELVRFQDPTHSNWTLIKTSHMLACHETAPHRQRAHPIPPTTTNGISPVSRYRGDHPCETGHRRESH